MLHDKLASLLVVAHGTIGEFASRGHELLVSSVSSVNQYKPVTIFNFVKKLIP